MKYRVRLDSIIVAWNLTKEEARAHAVMLGSQMVQRCTTADRAAYQGKVDDVWRGRLDQFAISDWRIALEKDEAEAPT